MSAEPASYVYIAFKDDKILDVVFFKKDFPDKFFRSDKVKIEQYYSKYTVKTFLEKFM